MSDDFFADGKFGNTIAAREDVILGECNGFLTGSLIMTWNGYLMNVQMLWKTQLLASLLM